MGGHLVQPISVAAGYQGSGGGGVCQYITCNDQHRLGPAVNKMTKKKDRREVAELKGTMEIVSGLVPSQKAEDRELYSFRRLENIERHET